MNEMMHHFVQDITPIIVLSIGTIASAWVIGQIIGAYRQRARLRAQAELYNRILDKFGTAEEFTNFLQTSDGRAFFENQAVAPAAPLGKVLTSIKVGTILLIVGGGLFVLSLIAKTEDAIFTLDIASVIALTLGIGFLVSSFISYRLAKSWGIIQPPPANVNQPATIAAP